MIRNFKTLGLAVIAALALTAVFASAALATGSYTASSYPTTGTGTSASGNDVFTTEAGSVECDAHFEGSLTEASTTFVVQPTYTNCKAFGFATATVTTPDCHLGLSGVTSTGGNAWHANSGTWTCNTGSKKPTTIVAGNCEVQVGEQNLTGSMQITNNAGGDISVQASYEKMSYTVTKDGFLCPFAGTGAKTGATYKQASAITFDSTNGASISVS
ncbi:MAG TPA: hypothetical protein VLI94_14075 [Solirubrobacterales bacterium]|nr:hypothetical protein [Solirubrobacterales bacterium]